MRAAGTLRRFRPRRPHLGRESAFRRPATLAIFSLGMVLGGVVVTLYAPLPSLEQRSPVQGAVVLDRNGLVLQRDLADGVRIPVPLDRIAPAMLAATIAAEDARFHTHPGIDPFAMARAVVRAPWDRSGASTITQQVARGLYLSGSSLPLPLRKAREAVIAVQLDARHSKDEILAAYLNSVYYGRGAYGVEAAARVYFGVPASSLDTAQAAFLAGLPQSPAAYGDAAGLPAARSRQRYVLNQMVGRGDLRPAAADEIFDRPLTFATGDDALIAQHFIGFVYDELATLRPDLLDTPGLIIESTLDASLQEEAERSVRVRLENIAGKNATNAGVVVLEPGTGAILTMVGSVDFFGQSDGQVNMTVQRRQPGSALKPFLYLAAFERGYTPATPLLDIATTFDTPTGPYAPRNYDGRFHGPCRSAPPWLRRSTSPPCAPSRRSASIPSSTSPTGSASAPSEQRRPTGSRSPWASARCACSTSPPPTASWPTPAPSSHRTRSAASATTPAP